MNFKNFIYSLIFITLLILSVNSHSETNELLEINWHISSEVEIGKSRFSENLDALKLCKVENCLIELSQHDGILSGVSISNRNLSILYLMTESKKIEEFQNLIMDSSSGFTKNQSSSDECLTYYKFKQYSDPISYGLTNEEFLSFYPGYKVGIGWSFFETQELEFCSGVVNIMRYISF